MVSDAISVIVFNGSKDKELSLLSIHVDLFIYYNNEYLSKNQPNDDDSSL